jgi:23S rRNA pseudouridine955/2504/2580 synthase
MIAAMEWITTDDEEGLQALQLLLRRVPAAPRAYLRQLLRRGQIVREGLPLDEGATISGGQRLILPDSGRLQQLLAETAQRPVILLDGPDFLVVDKPSGVAVHRGLGHEQDHLAGRVQAAMKQSGHPFMTAPVHRLDVGTSGPVLFAKGRRAAAMLGDLFMAGQVEKIYLALATGHLTGADTLTTPVPAKGRMRTCSTTFQALHSTGKFTLLNIQLHSGRQHQIRRQLADLGHPLAGDRRYGGAPAAGLNRLFLHCCRLTLPNPFAGGVLTVESPLPAELQRVLAALGIPAP